MSSVVTDDTPSVLGDILDRRLDCDVWSVCLLKPKLGCHVVRRLTTTVIGLILAVVLNAGTVFSFSEISPAPNVSEQKEMTQ